MNKDILNQMLNRIFNQIRSAFLMTVLMGVLVSILGCADPESNVTPELLQDDSQEANDRSSIVNGELVKVTSPIAKGTVVVARLQQSRVVGFCTGTLVSKSVVLTAAHCVNGGDIIRIAFINDVSQFKLKDGHRPVKKSVHPAWRDEDRVRRKESILEGDLALLKISGPIPHGYQPIQFLPGEFNVQAGETLVLAGYGVTSPRAPFSSATRLHQTTAVVREWHQKTQAKTHRIVDGTPRSICHGDSGGPGLVSRNGQFYLWGIANAVASKDCSGLMIYAVIRPFQSWLMSEIHKLEK